ncbi:MAG: threonine synthase [Sulfurospirillum sp.]|nr:threonine synthase [Sulfurospirillum sp.]
MFIETRGNDGNRDKNVEFSHAIMNPSASFGGLYVPKNLPKIDLKFLQLATKKSYKETALDILELFDIDIEKSVLKKALSLYDDFDNKENPVALTQIKNDLFVNELYHGPTRAFKDMALQPFGHILSNEAKKLNQDYLILVATSGDTGPATLDTFSNKKNIKVVCLYPHGGTSDVQRLQMVTKNGKNLKVIGIEGNFDDAQNTLKSLLASETFKQKLESHNIKLSAANSVNFGRIIFQIIYHIFAYVSLLKQNHLSLGDKFYQIVPSGNFGNALGAYYAKKMGLPIEKILIASNINNILTDLITKGEYNLKNRKLFATSSPAMDILISSNVERVLYDKYGAKRCKEMMEQLKKEQYYKLSSEELLELQKDFSAIHCCDNFVKKTIKKFIDENYIMDPHTATCIKAYNKLREKNIPSVLCSTAEWTKFAPTMLSSINNDTKKHHDKKALKDISNSLHVKIPDSINSLFEKDILYSKVIDKKNIEKEILEFIK